MSNIGMMEGAYFVGRVELLNWLNDLLKLDYTKVEQTASGAAHCQIMDALFPGKVPLHRVNFAAKHDYEFIANFKILQTVFDKLGLDKHIDVPKLVKAKYQDNLEFLQWMKRYFDLNYSGGEYDALDRRNQAAIKASQKPEKSSSTASKPAPSVKKTTPASSNISTSKITAKPTAVPAKKAATKTPEPKATKVESSSDEKAKIQELTQTNAEMKMNIEAVEKERDFYFGKLRDIEILCQQHDDPELDVLQKIFKILYATDEAEGFVGTEEQPQEDEESF